MGDAITNVRTGCRISKVRYKNSNLVQIIPRKVRHDYRKRMHKNVDTICDSFDEDDTEIAGYAVVAIGQDGTWNAGYGISPHAHFGDTLFPTLVADVLRKDMNDREP